jgi:hypothetical protein
MIVLIESPYRNGNRADNLRYLAWCEYHSASLGEHPIASHGNCTAYWPEDDEHRVKGFAWRDSLRQVVALAAFYTDLGLSPGAQSALERDRSKGLSVELRVLPASLFMAYQGGGFPPGSMRRVPAVSYL